MSNPAWLWLVDANGSPLVGSSLVTNRIGAIEIRSLTHNVNHPTDGNTGRLTGKRLCHRAGPKAGLSYLPYSTFVARSSFSSG